ncbi:MAG: hypothetical protein ACI8XO_003813 [Verrucomicrobiales bacterium]|jgi:hypothetical protein
MIDPCYYTLGALFSGVCAALALVSAIAMRRRGLMVVVNRLAFAVIGLGAVAAAIEFGGLLMLFGDDPYERAAFVNLTTGPYALYYWAGMVSTVIVPQLFWIRKFRSTAWIALVISLVILWQPILVMVLGLLP